MKSILRIAAAAGVALSATAALAQSGNGSDVSGPAGFTFPGGSFTPLPAPGTSVAGPSGVGGSLGASPSAGPSITATAQSFSSGAPVTSPATGQTIPAGAVSSVGSLLSGGSLAAVSAVGGPLQSAGAPPAAVANLMEALSALSNASSESAPRAIIAASQAFNTLVASVPGSFFTSSNGGPPAAFLAVHAALVPMIGSIGH
jgi:hypothetical protein